MVGVSNISHHMIVTITLDITIGFLAQYDISDKRNDDHYFYDAKSISYQKQKKHDDDNVFHLPSSSPSKHHIIYIQT